MNSYSLVDDHRHEGQEGTTATMRIVGTRGLTWKNGSAFMLWKVSRSCWRPLTN